MILRNAWSPSVLILPLLILLSVAASSTAIGATSNFRLNGDTATALFDAPDPVDSCLRNFAFVAVSDLIQNLSASGRPTAEFRIVLDVAQTNVCTNTLIFDGEGVSETSADFQVAGDLSSATLTAQVVVFNTIEALGYPFQMSLTWHASTKPEFVQSKETFRDPKLGIKILAQSRSMVAQAIAKGTVVGVGQNFTPEASDSATIEKHNNGALLIEKMTVPSPPPSGRNK